MGPVSIFGNFMFVRWFFECLAMLIHLSRYVEPPKAVTTKSEYFAYLDSLQK